MMNGEEKMMKLMDLTSLPNIKEFFYQYFEKEKEKNEKKI